MTNTIKGFNIFYDKIRKKNLKSAFNQINIYYFDDVELTHVD